MTCKRARQYLQLSRPGELSPRERRRLADHVRSCPACAGEEQAIRRTDAWIAGAREFSPPPEEASGLAAMVMEAVRNLDSKQSGRVRMSRRFPRLWPGVPTLPKALAGAVIVLLTILAAQTWMVLKKVSSLQGAMERRGEQALASRGEIQATALVRRAVAGLEADGETAGNGRTRLVIEKATLVDLLALARSLSAEDFARFERILSRMTTRPWGSSPGFLSEDDRIFLLKKQTELRIRVRGR